MNRLRTQALELGTWHHDAQGKSTEREEVIPVSIFPTKVLLATDGSSEAQLAATTAADLATGTSSELHVVHVGEWTPTFLAQTEQEPAELQREARHRLDEEVRRVEEAGGTVAETHLRQGRAAEEIVELAESLGIGMIVMGSRGRGRIRRALMGSVSDSVVRHAHCPVTIVRE
jgi:nucleotide-binding universal stress UspA family protein